MTEPVLSQFFFSSDFFQSIILIFRSVLPASFYTYSESSSLFSCSFSIFNLRRSGPQRAPFGGISNLSTSSSARLKANANSLAFSIFLTLLSFFHYYAYILLTASLRFLLTLSYTQKSKLLYAYKWPVEKKVPSASIACLGAVVHLETSDLVVTCDLAVGSGLFFSCFFSW
jgi:hypothetical protein